MKAAPLHCPLANHPPSYLSPTICITHHEAQIVYDTLEQELILSPMSFMDLAKPPLKTNDAYKVLEQIIEEEGIVNPMPSSSFQQNRHKRKISKSITEYYRMNVPNQTINNAHMEEWSILSTRMSYPSTPSLTLTYMFKTPLIKLMSGSRTLTNPY